MTKLHFAAAFSLILTGSCLTLHESTGALARTQEETPLPACIGDSSTWESSWGDCSTYAESANDNYYYCDSDSAEGMLAEEVCSECNDCRDTVSATGDPHLVNANGEKFDVNQPGEYTLVRVPKDTKMPAMLEMNVSLKPAEGETCGLWIQRVQYGGSLFNNLVVNVWPEMRKKGAEDCSESGKVRPFAFQTEDGHGPVTGNYVREQSHAFQAPNATHTRDAAVWTSCKTQQDRTCVEIVPLIKSVHDRGETYQAASFKFPIKEFKSGNSSKRILGRLVVTQRRMSPHSCRQALDVSVTGLNRLGFKEIGGILGTDGHDAHIEKSSPECVAAEKSKLEKAKGKSRMRMRNVGGSTMRFK